MPAPFADDRVEPGPGGLLTLACRSHKDWRPRTAAGPRRAAHPGTAVAWEGSIYEVVEESAGPDGTFRYALAPWRDDLAIRTLLTYDAESERRRMEERAWRAEAVRRRKFAILLSPLLGHLPGSVQERMEREFGAPANAMTYASALPLFALGFIGAFAAVARMAGGSLAPLPEPPLALSAYLLLESTFRLVVVVTQSQPAGSLPGAVAWALWSKLRGPSGR